MQIANWFDRPTCVDVFSYPVNRSGKISENINYFHYLQYAIDRLRFLSAAWRVSVRIDFTKRREKIKKMDNLTRKIWIVNVCKKWKIGTWSIAIWINSSDENSSMSKYLVVRGRGKKIRHDKLLQYFILCCTSWKKLKSYNYRNVSYRTNREEFDLVGANTTIMESRNNALSTDIKRHYTV